MHKTQLIPLFSAWVKNVYSLRTVGGMNSGYIQDSYTAPMYSNSVIRVQVPSFTQLSTKFSAVLSTLKNRFLPLLFVELYPVSTVPTIKRTTENKERNS
jgi:hypothetical protein